MTATMKQPPRILPGVITKSQWLPPKMCIYGPPGIGKSTFGAGAPNPIFIPTEAGVENLNVARFPVAKTLKDFLDTLNLVAKEEHDHGAVVIDTLNGLTDLYYQAKKDIPGGAGKSGDIRPLYDFVGFGGFSGWSAVARDIAADIFEPLSECQRKGMFVILLAHTGEYTRKNPTGDDLTVAAPSISKWVWKAIHPWLDVIGRADYHYVESFYTDKMGKAIAKAKTTEEAVNGVKVKLRQLIFDGGAEQDCKTRIGYELPPEIDLSWEIFQNHLGNISALTGEVRDLWRHIPPDKIGATLSMLGIDSVDHLSDAGREKLSLLRNRLLEMEKAAEAMEDKPEQSQAHEALAV